MRIIISELIDQLEKIVKKFNESIDPTERYALLIAYNHICEKQLPIHDCMENRTREGMLSSMGILH